MKMYLTYLFKCSSVQFQNGVNRFHINCQKNLLNFPSCRYTPQLEIREKELLMKMMEVEEKCRKKILGKSKTDVSKSEQFNGNNIKVLEMSTSDLEWKERAATVIQRYFRGYKARKLCIMLRSHDKEGKSNINNSSNQKTLHINFDKKKYTHHLFRSDKIKPSISSGSVR